MDFSEADHAVVFNTLYTGLQCVCVGGGGGGEGGGGREDEILTVECKLVKGVCIKL